MSAFPAGFDTRRDSLTSQQSSASYAQSLASLRSSGSSSFYSPRQPATPPGALGTRDDPVFFHESMVYDASTPLDQGAHDLSGYYPRDASPNGIIPKSHSLQTASQSDWTTPSFPDGLARPLLSMSSESFATCTSPYTPELASMLPQTPLHNERPSATHAYTESSAWQTPSVLDGPPGMSPDIAQYPRYAEGFHESPITLQFTWSAGHAPGHVYDHVSYINPANNVVSPEAIFPNGDLVRDDSHTEHYHPGINDDQDYYQTLPQGPQPTLRSSVPSLEGEFSQTSAKEQQRSARTPSATKGIKKDKHSSISKRTRSKKSDVTYVYRTDRPITVQIEGGIEKDSDGKWVNMVDALQRKKFVCEEMNGEQICGRTFKRPEHLKRHVKTHTGEQNFTCGFPIWVSEDGERQLRECPKRFGRNDNCAAHFRTHVQQDRQGYYFPAYNVTSDDINKMTSEELTHWAEHMSSGFDGLKKGSRNCRWPWEEFVRSVNNLKSMDDSKKLIISVFKSCLKEDEKRRLESMRPFVC